MTGKKLSIIIVGYNAESFLDITLYTLQQAIENINAEVLFVDNSNNAELKKLVSTKYDFVRTIENTENLGFSKGNNLALKEAKGEYVLFLNPDTIVSNNSILEAIDYLDKYCDTGAVGVHMINGTGSFLGESKGAFPSIAVSFYKLSGLTRVFPKSKRFGAYYLGHLPEFENYKVDRLSGAFLMLRRKKDSQFIEFDPQFFMYAEDFDLSYRINKELGKTAYLGKASIVHFKGKTTVINKHTIFHFYYSMWLFYRKNIARKKSIIINSFIKASVWTFIGLQQIRNVVINSLSSKPKPLKNIEEIYIVSDNSKLTQQIESSINSSLNSKDGLIDRKAKIIQLHDLSNIKSNQLVIFDLKFIDSTEIINFMEKQTCYYAFITPNSNKFVISTKSLDKGRIFEF